MYLLWEKYPLKEWGITIDDEFNKIASATTSYTESKYLKKTARLFMNENIKQTHPPCIH